MTCSTIYELYSPNKWQYKQVAEKEYRRSSPH